MWIPVEIVYTNGNGSTSEMINLGRYNFAEDGTPSAYSGDFKEENSQDTETLLKYGNTIAKDIEALKQVQQKTKVIILEDMKRKV